MTRLGRLWRLTPGRIAGGYVLFGVAWIGVSDQVVLALFETESTRLTAQTVKGWVFVGLSALLIFGLSSVREQQLKRARQRALAASQQLQVLHRVFRHNIRNDMTVIRGYAQLLHDRVDEDAVNQWANRVLETATEIIELSEKLQVVGDVDDEPDGTVDLVVIVETELDQFRNKYPGVDLSVALPERALVAGTWTVQYAVREALENAMEHHPAAPGDRQIGVALATSDGTATLEIADDGPGIPRAEIAPIEAGEEKPLSHGSGVGLWLIAWLCEKNGGSVAFPAGEHTTVALRLPRVEPVEEVASALGHSVLASARVRNAPEN
jgi:signal transduction histidine kinase